MRLLSIFVISLIGLMCLDQARAGTTRVQNAPEGHDTGFFTRIHLTGDGSKKTPLDFSSLADAHVSVGQGKFDSLASIIVELAEVTDFCKQPDNANVWVKYKGLRSGWTVHILKALHAIKGAMVATANIIGAPVLAPVIAIEAKIVQHKGRKKDPTFRTEFSMSNFVKEAFNEFPNIVNEEIAKSKLVSRNVQCKNLIQKKFCKSDCRSCKKDAALAGACVNYCKGNKWVQKKCTHVKRPVQPLTAPEHHSSAQAMYDEL